MAGTDKIVKEYFFSLTNSELKKIFFEYGKLFGEVKLAYAEKSFKKWKTGKVKMSGDVAQRLFSLLPRHMPQNKKFDIVEALWHKWSPSSKKVFYINEETSSEHLIDEVKAHLDSVVREYYIPNELTEQFTWLAGRDAILFQQLKNHFLDLEKKLIKNASFERISFILNQLKTSENYQKIRQSFILGKHEVILELQHQNKKVVSEIGESTNYKSNTDNPCLIFFVVAGLVLFFLALRS